MRLLNKICFCLLLALTSLGAGGAEPKRVLFIHSFGRGFEPYHTIAGRLRTELASQMAEPIDFFEASLESARFTSLEHESPLLEYLRAQFAGHHLDLVVPVGGPAVQFVQRHRQLLFPETPMLATVDQRLFNSTNQTAHDVAALTVNEPGLTVETLLQVLPETTNVVVVMGNSAIERLWSAQIRRELQPYTNGVSFVWLDQLPFSETLKQCATLPPRSAIFFPLLFVDAAGVPHLEEHAMLRLHEAANAPIFGVWINQLGQGILGGRLMDIEEFSRKAANSAARILRGESPGSINMPPQRVGPPEFDWRELRRWGISEARLPAGSVVRFRQPGLWERYWWLVCGGVLFGSAEAVLIVGLLINQAKRREGEAVATLIAELSSRFVNVPTDKLDNEIEAAQRRICEGMGLDFCALWQWTDGSPRYFMMTHLYRPLGGPLTPERFDAQEAFPWCLKELLAGRVIPVSSMDELPAEAGRDRESWRHFGIKSNLTFPLLAEGGKLIGGLSFNTVRKARSWPEELVTRLELVAQIFANALARKHADQELRESEERLSMATAAGNVGVWMWEVAVDRFWATQNWRLMFGFPPEAVIRYATVLQRIHEKDRAAVDLAVRHALDDKADFVSDHRVLLPDGTIRWITAHGRVHPGADAKQLRLLGGSVDITERKHAEEAALDLSGRLLRAQEDERARLAKELHDGLGQNLALLSVEMEMFGQRLPPEPGQIDAQLKELSQHAKGISAEVHRISHDLHPAKLEQLGLAVALRSICRRVSTAHGIVVSCEAHDAPRVLPEDVALCLYRVAQEAIQNVVKHSKAKNAWVEVTAANGVVHLRVKDDGQGFEVNAARAEASLGLVSMQERVRLARGQLTVRSKPREGTQIDVRLELPEEKNR